MTHTVGLVPGSYKPYHIGHDMLVRIAASECDEVHLFVSTSDRIRPGQVPIYGAVMKKIWQTFLEPSLPSNVSVTYGGSPVQHVYEDIEAAEADDDRDVHFKIYSDDVDVLKYSDAALKKSAPKLFKRKQIERRGVKRTETVNVSGTEMRGYLQTGDVKKFVSLLPPAVQKSGKKIYDMLRHGVDESLIRQYVSAVVAG